MALGRGQAGLVLLPICLAGSRGGEGRPTPAQRLLLQLFCVQSWEGPQRAHLGQADPGLQRVGHLSPQQGQAQDRSLLAVRMGVA